MASTASAIVCAVLALLLWAGVGWVLARRLPLHPALALPLAPALGWSVQNVAALAVSLCLGFSAPILVGVTLAVGAVSLAFVRPQPPVPTMPWWIWAAAAAVAVAPAAAVLPKHAGDGVVLAAAIYDHAKVALIDEIALHGVPPANPVLADGGAGGRVAYYYLWHFGAAQLARLSGATGWEADIAASWFTAFASLTLMAGLAFRFAGRARAPAFALVACCCGSLRPLLAAALGEDAVDRLLRPATGLAGWLFQTTWSPHHVASAGAAVVATLLAARLAVTPSLRVTIVLALVLAAGFESSLWVGGIVVAAGGGAVALVLLAAAETGRRRPFLVAGAAAAVLSVGLAMPLILEQAHAAAARGGGAPVSVTAFPVLGPAFGETLRRVLDLPAYWLVLLPLELPAILVPGVLALAALVRSTARDTEDRLSVPALAALAMASLACGWLLVSTAGENNDLGWRAILPAVLVLTAAAGAGLARWRARPAVVVAMALAAAAAVPDGAALVAGNVQGDPASSGAAFARDPQMWAAVRRHTDPDGRVASNPLYLADLVPWPIDLSWALLARRRSCFAGREMALAFAPLAPADREAVATLFERVFAGDGSAADVAALRRRWGCRTALVTADDGAWSRDPFGTSPLWRRAEEMPGRWRIHVAVDPPAAP